jgi:hypothetical protein
MANHRASRTSDASKLIRERRANARKVLQLDARITWTDRGGQHQSATVITRNISTSGIYVESETPLSIPLFRLVECRIEGSAPSAPRQERAVLAAVYRVSRMESATGLALRVLADLPR